MKYKVIKIRQKISFMAFNECQTVLEFMAKKIHESLVSLIIKGEIEAEKNFDNVHVEFAKIINSNVVSYFKQLMIYNAKNGGINSKYFVQKIEEEMRNIEKQNFKEKILVRNKNEKNFKYVEIDNQE